MLDGHISLNPRSSLRLILLDTVKAVWNTLASYFVFVATVELGLLGTSQKLQLDYSWLNRHVSLLPQFVPLCIEGASTLNTSTQYPYLQ